MQAALSGNKRRRPQGPAFPGAPTLFEDKKQSKSLKNRIRSVQRLLAKPGLPKQALKDKKRLLKKLQRQLDDEKFRAAEFKYGARYHKIKFFERQKITRAIHKTERFINALSGDKDKGVDAAEARIGFGVGETLHRDVSERIKTTDSRKSQLSCAKELLQLLQQDLIYIKWFPRHCKYIGLLAADGGAEESDTAADKTATSQKKIDKVNKFRKWSLANASAGQFLRTCPEELSESVADIISKRFGAYADGRADIAATAPTQALQDDLIDDEDDDDDDDDEVEGTIAAKKKGKAAIRAAEYDSDNTSDDEDDEHTGKAKAKTPISNSAKRVRVVDNSKGSAKSSEKEKRITHKVNESDSDDDEADSASSGDSDASSDESDALHNDTSRTKNQKKRAEAEAPAQSSRKKQVPQRVLPKAADEDDADAAADGAGDDSVAADPFFAAAGAGVSDVAGVTYDEDGLPIFREEIPDEITEEAQQQHAGAAWNTKFYGPRTAAARYEREHLHQPRYRDSATARRAGSDGAAPDLSHLSERKRRRAERGLAFAAGKSSGYTEAFFGTEMDSGAKLKHVEREKKAARATAGASSSSSLPFHKRAGDATGAYKPRARPANADFSGGKHRDKAGAFNGSTASTPGLNKPAATHLKFV